MKQLLILMCLLAISAAGCSTSLWCYTDDSVDSLGLRAGVNVDRLEVGAQHYYESYHDSGGEWGTYGIVHLAPDETIDPYIGIQTTDEFDFEQYSSFLGGFIVGPVFIEYQEETIRGETDNLLIGTKFNF